MSPPLPPPPSFGAPYIHLPGVNMQFQGCGCLGPCGAQNCLTWGTGGNVSYPNIGSQFSPAHGGAESEPGGWSGLTPNPGTPLPGTGAENLFWERDLAN